MKNPYEWLVDAINTIPTVGVAVAASSASPLTMVTTEPEMTPTDKRPRAVRPEPLQGYLPLRRIMLAYRLTTSGALRSVHDDFRKPQERTLRRRGSWPTSSNWATAAPAGIQGRDFAIIGQAPRAIDGPRIS